MSLTPENPDLSCLGSLPGHVESSRRARTGILRRSCETCRTLKARCIVPESTGPRRCKRCLENNIDCVFEESIARSKRQRLVPPTRAKDMEAKIDSLTALVVAKISADTAAEAKRLSDLAVPFFERSSEPYTISEIAEWNGKGFPAYFGSSTSPMPELQLSTVARNDVFSRGVVSSEFARDCLAQFTADASYIPFIVLGSHMDLDFLRRERPSLLLAIMVRYSENPVQERLLLELKQRIAQHVIVQDGNGIDSIQALIVHCAWQNKCVNSNIGQLYKLTQLAVSMAAEMRLPSLAQIREMGLQHASMSRTSLDLNSQFSDDLERMRAYLGCYHVSHGVAIASRKPTHLKHSRRIEEAARVIAELKQVPTDCLIPHLVRLQRLVEDVQSTFGYDDLDSTAEMDAVKIQTMAKVFERRLSQTLADMPLDIRQCAPIQLEALFLGIYTTEIGLKAPPGHEAVTGHCCDWCSSVHRANLVVSCIRASQNYIKHYLALPDEVLYKLNVLQVGRHMYAMLILGRVKMREQMEHLDIDALAELVAAKEYVDISNRRIAALVTRSADGKPKQDTFWMFQQVFKMASACENEQKSIQSTPGRFHDCVISFKLNNLLLGAPGTTIYGSSTTAQEASNTDTLCHRPTTTEKASAPWEDEMAEGPWMQDQGMFSTADLSTYSTDAWFHN